MISATNVLGHHGNRRAVERVAEIELQVLEGSTWRRWTGLPLPLGRPTAEQRAAIWRWILATDE